MKKLKIIVLVLTLICFLKLSWASADEGTLVEVEGQSSIYNGNSVQAERLATIDAMRKAIEQVLGTFVDAKTDVVNFQVIRDGIQTSTEGFIANYEVLQVNYVNNVCRVTIRATVKKDVLHQKVDELKQTILWSGKPRVLVLIDEPYDTVEPIIVQGLIQAGFPVVENDQIQSINKSETVNLLFYGDASGMEKISKSRQADILIIGQTQINKLSTIEGLISCQVYLTIKAIKVLTGDILATQSFDEKGVDSSIDSAGQKAIQKLGSKIVVFLKNQLGKQLVDNNRSIQLIVGKINYSELQMLQQHLKNTPLVKNVFLRDYSSNTAKLDVETSLLAEQMADQVLTWSDLSLEIDTLSNGKIEMFKK